MKNPTPSETPLVSSAEFTLTPLSAKDDSEKLNQSQGLSIYIKNVFRLAVPNTITSSTWVIQSLIGIYYVSLLDDVKLLDGMSLGYSWAGVFGYSLISGFGSALDTFVTQFYGSKDYKACGRMLNKAFLILGMMCIPCLFFQWMSGTVFYWVGIDAEVSMYSFRVAITLTPSIIAYVPLVLIEKFLMGQQITKPQMVIQLINTVLYPLYCHICVFWLDWGLYGVVIVKAGSEIIYVVALICYIKISHCCDESLVAPSADMLKGWGQYIAVAWPSLFLTSLEWWGFEILNLICGKVGPIDLAANVIGSNYINLIFLSCVGVGISSATLVGNSIGEGNIKNAKRYILVGVGMTLGIIFMINIILFTFRPQLSRVYSKNEEVVELVSNIICIMMVQNLFDATQGTLGKILIAMGRQAIASWINLFSYYTIMVPVGAIAAFWWGWRVYGTWFSSTVATFFVCIGFACIIYRENWENIKQKALEDTNETA